MKNICIIGAGGFNEGIFDPPDNSFIIAADNGLKYLEKLGFKADMVIGDFDSYGHRPKGENVLSFPSRKDQTDIGISIEYGLKNGFDSFYIYGGLGGRRFEHSYANIQLLYGLAKKNKDCFLIGENEICTAIGSSELVFSERCSGYISIFSLSSNSDISIEGLSYENDEIHLRSAFPLGVSNEFLGKKSRISVKKGYCLIIWHGKYSDLSVIRK